MSTLEKKSQELMRSFQPDAVEEVQGLVVTFYIGQCDSNPIGFSYVSPVSWERRVEAKDRFEALLRRFGRTVIGSVILGLSEEDMPKNEEEAVEYIYSMVPQDVPHKMLSRALQKVRVH